MDEMNRAPGLYSGCFLYDEANRRVLLQLRDDKAPIAPNKWSFFGGGGEPGETAAECAVRELKEEIGMAFEESELIHLWDYLNPERHTQRNIFYINKYVPKENLVLGEGAGFDWIPLSDLDRYDLTEYTKKDLIRFRDDYMAAK